MADVIASTEQLGSSIASGSFLTMGMMVMPCSIKSLSGIVNSYADNLLTRALMLLERETANFFYGS